MSYHHHDVVFYSNPKQERKPSSIPDPRKKKEKIRPMIYTRGAALAHSLRDRPAQGIVAAEFLSARLSEERLGLGSV